MRPKRQQKKQIESESESDGVEDAPAPHVVDIYEEFGIARDATESDIKTSYRKLCLKYHPDKLGGASEEERVTATQKFQQIASWYQILSDPIKRQRYDETGSLDDNDWVFAEKGDVSWDEFFRSLWTGLVTKETIEEYSAKYKGSEQEKEDVLKAFNDVKGDVLDMLDYIILSELDELDRYKAIVQSAIDAGETEYQIKEDPKKLIKMKKKAMKEEKEAEELAKELDARKTRKKKKELPTEEIGLHNMRERHEKAFSSLIQRLEEKATSEAKQKAITGKGQKRKAPVVPELSDADFEAFQAKMEKERAAKKDREADDPQPPTSKRKAKGGADKGSKRKKGK
ncbi:hypothetical protein DFJ77DRAFT_544799 [Powellomyces hirtus]|nr:hypothetical protein DFJ77DRAFT_544799 [Powellomyces hirtus]